MEGKVKVLDVGDFVSIKNFYERRKFLVEKNSEIQAKHWFSLNMVRLVFLLGCVVVFTWGNYGLTQGQTISMYMYINEFLISLMVIPIAVETFMRIKDVIKRLV
jgi:Ca2+/Na+ antiporter